MSDDIRLKMVLEQEAEVADKLDALILQAQRDADVLDPRSAPDKHRPLPTEHPATRLRYIAYRIRRAREALL